MPCRRRQGRPRSATDDVGTYVVRRIAGIGEGQYRWAGRAATIRAMQDAGQAAAPPLRVIVIDADDRIRESLTGLLAIGDRVLVVGSAGQAPEAVELATRVHPDVVVLDPRLPEVESGIALMHRLRALVPDVRILAMSWSDSLEGTLLSGGADRFVRKTLRPAELVAAIIATSAAPSS